MCLTRITSYSLNDRSHCVFWCHFVSLITAPGQVFRFAFHSHPLSPCEFPVYPQLASVTLAVALLGMHMCLSLLCAFFPFHSPFSHFVSQLLESTLSPKSQLFVQGRRERERERERERI